LPFISPNNLINNSLAAFITAGIATKPAVINAANSQFKTVRVTLDPSIKYEIPGIKIESFEKFLKIFNL